MYSQNLLNEEFREYITTERRTFNFEKRKNLWRQNDERTYSHNSHRKNDRYEKNNRRDGFDKKDRRGSFDRHDKKDVRNRFNRQNGNDNRHSFSDKNHYSDKHRDEDQKKKSAIQSVNPGTYSCKNN